MLKLMIEGRWEPEDFIEVLEGVESLYYKAAIRSKRQRDARLFWLTRPMLPFSPAEQLDYANDRLLVWARTTVPDPERITVRRIEYASPGGIDLAGIGEAFKAVEGIVEKLIKFFTERELRREWDKQAGFDTAIRGIEFEKEQEPLRALKIANTRAILELHDDYPEIADELLLPLIVRDQDRLIPRISERKLIGVRREEDSTKEALDDLY